MRILLIICFFCMLFNTNAQDLKSPIKDKAIATAYLKNSVITIDNQIFDYRQLRHYGEENLRNMDSKKRKTIHYIYTESYKVINTYNCQNFTDIDINISQIEALRKQDISSFVDYKLESGCIVNVELFARKIIEEEINKIK